MFQRAGFTFHDASLAALARIARGLDARMDGDDDDDPDEGRHGRRSESELADQVRRLVSSRGGGESGAMAVALKLLDDNEKAREGRRKAKERVTELEKIVPKEGQVIVSKADADAFALYKAHGTPEEVKTKIEKGVTLEGDIKKRDTSALIAEAAGVAKINGKLLAKLADPSRENFVVELRDEQQDGKTVKVPYARKNEANAPFKALAEFAKTELAEYHAALVVTDSGTTAAGPESHTTSFPPQSPTNTVPAGGAPAVDKFIKDRNAAAAARPNPLGPAPAAAAKT